MYNLGDKLIVISREKYEELKGNEEYVSKSKLDKTCSMTDDMAEFCSKVVTISHVDTNDETYHIKEDPRHFWWSDAMFTAMATEEEIKATLEEDCSEPTYKVGDTVSVISREKYEELKSRNGRINSNKLDGRYSFTSVMAVLCGETVTIEAVDPLDGTYTIKEDVGQNWWSDAMFTGLSDAEPISKEIIEERIQNLHIEVVEKLRDKLKSDIGDMLKRITDDTTTHEDEEATIEIKKEEKRSMDYNVASKQINKIKSAMRILKNSGIDLEITENGMMVTGEDYKIAVHF